MVNGNIPDIENKEIHNVAMQKYFKLNESYEELKNITYQIWNEKLPF